MGLNRFIKHSCALEVVSYLTEGDGDERPRGRRRSRRLVAETEPRHLPRRRVLTDLRQGDKFTDLHCVDSRKLSLAEVESYLFSFLRYRSAAVR